MRHRLLVAGVYLTPLAAAVLLFVGGSAPMPPGAPSVNDKLLHFVAFGVLVAVAWPAGIHLCRGRSRGRGWGLALAAVYATFIGLGLELWQSTIPHRDASWGDALADVLGVLCTSGLLTAGLHRAERRVGR